MMVCRDLDFEYVQALQIGQMDISSIMMDLESF